MLVGRRPRRLVVVSPRRVRIDGPELLAVQNQFFEVVYGASVRWPTIGCLQLLFPLRLRWNSQEFTRRRRLALVFLFGDNAGRLQKRSHLGVVEFGDELAT